MRHPKSTIQLLQIFRHFLLTLTPPPPRPTTNFTTTLTTTKEELHCSLNTQESGANNRHHSTVRSICHFTHILTSLFWMLPFSLLLCHTSTAVTTSSPRACCFVFIGALSRHLNLFATNLNTSIQSQFFCFTYIKKRLMMFIRTSLYTTSLGNVVEFGVPFVCWFCDDDFWGCTSHTHISL